MSLLLLPGPLSIGPAPVHAALRPADPDASTVFDAAGKGIGCQAGTRKYKGPGLPKEPPWPPGAEPTPSPTPTPEPSADADASADASAEPGAPGSPQPSPEPEAAAMAFVAATDARFVQAEVATGPVAPVKSKPGLLTGIDISRYQKDIDLGRVKEAGHRFVFIKATQDNEWVDPYFSTNMARARAAGLAAGAYHFFDYTLDGTAQADHFLDRVEAVDGIEDALPPVVDVECWEPIGASIHAVSATRLRDFVERVYERTGRMPIVYTSVFMWREVVGNAEGFEDLPLWAACWGCEAPPSLAPGWEEWTFWQEGLTRVPEVGRVDGNYFNGSKKELKALELRPFAVAGGAPATAGGRVELDLGGRDATHIRTSPDGETWSQWSQVGSRPTVRLPVEEGPHTVYAQLRNGPGLKSPVVSDTVVVDTTPPEISPPEISLRPGPLADGQTTIPVSVGWQARDEVAGLADATIAVTCDESPTQRTEAPGSAAPGELAEWQGEAWLPSDAACVVTAVGRDGVGNVSRATVDDTTVAMVAVTGDVPAADVSADQVGVIGRRGPDAGRATVLLDGEALALIDLYAPEAGAAELVYVTDLPAGDHTVTVEPTGSSDPASSGSAVIVDGFVTLTR